LNTLFNILLLLPIISFAQQQDTIINDNSNQGSLTVDSFIIAPEVLAEPLGDMFNFNYDLTTCQVGDMDQKHFLKLYIDSNGNVWKAVVLNPCSCEELMLNLRLIIVT